MVPNGIGFLSSHILCRLLMAWPRQSGRTTVRDSCRKIKVTGTSTADPTYIECHTLSGICTVIINSENVFSIILTSMSLCQCMIYRCLVDPTNMGNCLGSCACVQLIALKKHMHSFEITLMIIFIFMYHNIWISQILNICLCATCYLCLNKYLQSAVSRMV